MKEQVVLSIILISIVLPACGDDQVGQGPIIISSVSGSLQIGRPATISLELENNASAQQSPSIFGDKGTCLGITAELKSHDERIRVLSLPQTAGSLAPKENISLDFMASTDQGTDMGVYPLELILNYSMLSGVRETGEIPDVLFNYEGINEVLPLQLKASFRPGLTLDVSDTVAPGTETDLTVSFVNRGDEPISNLQAHLLPQYPFMPDEGEVHLGSIDPGGSVSARFRIITANHTISGYYALPCNVRFGCGQFQLDHNCELAAIVEVKERPWSDMAALPIVTMFLLAAIYLAIRARKDRRRFRRR